MDQIQISRTLFMTRVGTPFGKSCARLLIESLRSFGGVMQNCPFWIFEANPEKTTCQDMIDLNTRVLPLNAPASIRDFLFGEIDEKRLLILPPDYNYPYNLHQSLPAEHRVKAFNDLVSLVHEDRTINLQEIDDVEIHEPLYSWLLQRVKTLPRID